MVDRKELLKVITCSVFVSVITLIPYVMAHFLAEPTGVFSGFLIFPKDGFSYLAKMRQGFEGQWLFYLPYTIKPGEGTFIFVYFLFLGHLSRWLGIPSIFLYHMLRFLGSVMMFSSAYLLVARFLQSKAQRWRAFSFILIGGGLGWLALPLGLMASDLWIVESIPFLTAYANAHFPIAATLFLILVILILSENKSTRYKVGITFLASTLLAMIQPFSIIALFVFLFLWLLWETWNEVKTQNREEKTIREKWWIYLAMLLGALPWIIYDFWITLHHPEIAGWNAQNKTPSPLVIEYIFGFGGILIIAAFGLVRGQFKNSRTDRLLMIWVVSQAILLYSPFGLQRRLSMGLYFPMVIMAMMTLDKLIQNRRKLTFSIVILLMLSLPSNLVVVGSGIAGIMKMDPMVVLDRSEMEVYQWLSANTDPGKVILAGPVAGNRIPAFADLRVFYGHPFETVNAEEQMAFVEKAYASEDPNGEMYEDLLDLNVNYIFYSPEERELGHPVWLEKCELIFKIGEYAIYEIPSP